VLPAGRQRRTRHDRLGMRARVRPPLDMIAV
jgi:hypothetical protein